MNDARAKITLLQADATKAIRVYGKYILIKEMCEPLLADMNSVYFADQFKSVIEYALDHDTPPDNINTLLKKIDFGYGNFSI